MKFKKGDRLYLKVELSSEIRKCRPYLYKFNNFSQITFFGIDTSSKICAVSFKKTQHSLAELYCITVESIEKYFTKTAPPLINLKHYV